MIFIPTWPTIRWCMFDIPKCNSISTDGLIASPCKINCFWIWKQRRSRESNNHTKRLNWSSLKRHLTETWTWVNNLKNSSRSISLGRNKIYLFLLTGFVKIMILRPYWGCKIACWNICLSCYEKPMFKKKELYISYASWNDIKDLIISESSDDRSGWREVRWIKRSLSAFILLWKMNQV